MRETSARELLWEPCFGFFRQKCEQFSNFRNFNFKKLTGWAFALPSWVMKKAPRVAALHLEPFKKGVGVLYRYSKVWSNRSGQ